MVFEALLIKLEQLYSKRPSNLLLIKIEGILNKQLELSDDSATGSADTSMLDYQTVDFIAMNNRFTRRNKSQIANYISCHSSDKLKSFSENLLPQTLQIPVRRKAIPNQSYLDLLLGGALEEQLVVIEMVNRSTQTDWKWAVMALRWRNARLISPRIDNVKKKRKKARKSIKHHGHLIKKGTADTTGTTGTTASETSDSISEELTTLKDEILRRGENSLSSSSFQQVQFKKNSSKQLALVRELLEGDENIEDQDRLNKIHEDDEQSSLGSGNKKRNRRRPKSEPEKQWTIQENDKYVDTCDLNFDPYAPDLQYTPVRRFPATVDPVPPTPDTVVDVEDEFSENIKELPLSKTQSRKGSVKKRYSTSSLKRKSSAGSKTGSKPDIVLVSPPAGSKSGSKTNISLASPPNPLLTSADFENES